MPSCRGYPREEYVLSTKVGRLLVPDPDGAGRTDIDNGFDVPATTRRVWDFSADGVRRSLDESLQRLGLDRIDVALIHDPEESDDPEGALTTAYPALHELRAQGVVGAIGVGSKQSEILGRFVTETDIDVVMLAGRYTLLEQPALDDLLPACQARGVSVLNVGVFNSGLLAKDWPGRRRALRIRRHARGPAAAGAADRHAVPAVRHFAAACGARLRRRTPDRRERRGRGGAAGTHHPQCRARRDPAARPGDCGRICYAAGLLRPDAPVPGEAA